MSVELTPINDLALTLFYGGKKHGQCVQFTRAGQFVQLTLDEAAELSERLAFLREPKEPRD